MGAALLSSIPVLALGSLIWLTIAGAVSVSMYQRRVPAALVRPAMGLRLGALSGVFAFAITALISALRFTSQGNELRQLLQEQMQAQIAKTPDPRSQEILRELMAKVGTPEGMAAFFLWMLVLIAVVFLLFSALGGALGASASLRRRGLR